MVLLYDMEDRLESQSGEYVEHFGIPNQKKGRRRFQSYLVAPTRSGMVGQEVGEAAAQRARIRVGGKELRKETQDRWRKEDEEQKRQSNQNQSHDNNNINNASENRPAVPEKVVKNPLRTIEEERIQKKKADAIAKADAKAIYKQRQNFSTEELEDAMRRINASNAILNSSLNKVQDVSNKGANTLQNVARGLGGAVGIYNIVAGTVNAYRAYNSQDGYQKLPFIKTGDKEKKPSGGGH